MKNIPYLLFPLFLPFLPAQDAATAALPALPADPAAASNWVLDLALKYPWVSTAMLVLYAVGFLLKPIMSAFYAYTQSTSSTADDRVYEAIEHSTIYTTIAYCLDWVVRFKIVPPK